MQAHAELTAEPVQLIVLQMWWFLMTAVYRVVTLMASVHHAVTLMELVLVTVLVLLSV
jgi:hypothetical protein